MAKTPVSIRSLGRQVEQLSGQVGELKDAVDQDRRTTASVHTRLDTLNLNGSAAALKKLADNSEPLLRLAEAAPRITATVEREAEWATWWKVTKQLLNPLKPIGAAIWVVAAGVISLLIYSRI